MFILDFKKKGNLKDVSLYNQLVGQPINFKDLGKNEKSRSSPSCNTSASPLYRNLNNEKKLILIMFTFTQMFHNNFIYGRQYPIKTFLH